MEFGLNIAGVDNTLNQTARALDTEAVRDVLVSGTSVVDEKTGIANVEIPAIPKMVSLTQAQYDALTTKDASTLYVIVG